MQDDLAQLKDQLKHHPLYDAINTPDALRIFMERHIVAVWDFMSLLKYLQRELTCIDIPWAPVKDSQAARLINEIVLGEETDEISPGKFISHFDWYFQAMEQIQADAQPMHQFLELLHDRMSIENAIENAHFSTEAKSFLNQTFSTFQQPLYVVASVFFHAREDLIPRMFLTMVERLKKQGLECSILIDYLERHIEVDGEEHGPLAQQLLDRLIAGDPDRTQAARSAAIKSLKFLRDATLTRIQSTRESNSHFFANRAGAL